MSVEARRRNGKTTYRVRWREDGRERYRTFPLKRDADLFDAEVKRRAALGSLHQLTRSRTLLEFVRDTWAPQRTPDLATATRENYAGTYRCHLADTFDRMKLRDITAPKIAAWQAERRASGAGLKALQEARALLGGILTYAVEMGELDHNPVRDVRPVKRPRSAPPRPLPPVAVERIRAAIAAQTTRDVAASTGGRRPRRAHTAPGREPEHVERDLMLVAILAYSGLRPAEALALQWRDVTGDRLMVERAVDLRAGTLKGTKTDTPRVVRLLAPLAADLAAWRLRCGNPAPTQPIVPGAWTKTLWDNWRRRTWTPAVKTAELPPTRPYDLRHSYASLLLAEHRTVHYVAAQLGHGAEQTLRTYGHVIEHYRDSPAINAEHEIRLARGDAPANRGPKVAPTPERTTA